MTDISQLTDAFGTLATATQAALAAVQTRPASRGVFDVRDYGDGAGGTDWGPTISAAYVAASAFASAAVGSETTVFIPPGKFRVATSIIVKQHVRVEAYGAVLVGPITGAPVIWTVGTEVAGATDVDAQIAGACFTDDAPDTEDIRGLSFYGLRLEGFRWGFVSRCLAWYYALWQDVSFGFCNVGIFAYQASQMAHVIDCWSFWGTTFVAGATCFPSGHPFTGRDNFFCDGFSYMHTRAVAADESHDNPYFDAWFENSILRPSTASHTSLGTDASFGFDGTALHVSGRNIYIPGRGSRGAYHATVWGAKSLSCPRGVVLIGCPVSVSIKNVMCEGAFALGSDALVTILLGIATSSGSIASGTFENIDGLNTTNPGEAIAFAYKTGANAGPGLFYDLGNVLGAVDDYQSHFVLPGALR